MGRQVEFHGQDYPAGPGMFVAGILECPNFAGKGVRIIDGGADLDEFLAAVGMTGEEIVEVLARDRDAMRFKIG